jgi:adenine-specific DNA-methyltransferase
MNTEYLDKLTIEDCNDFMKKLEPRSIDTVILDPPYFNVVNEKWDTQWKDLDEYLAWFKPIIQEVSRVSKHSCSLWLFGYAYQLSYLIPIVEAQGFTYRQHITIDKGLRSVAGRTSNKLKMFPTATEYVIYFHKESRGLIREYLQKKQAETKKSSKDINLHLGKAINGGGTWSTIAGVKQKNIQYPTREDWDKLSDLFGDMTMNYDDMVFKFNPIQGLTDVWTDINFYDTKFPKKHPTQKPFKLIERLLLCSTDEGDVILDPFMGSCMTGLVCKKHGRHFIGCEKEETYAENNLLDLELE